MHTSIDDERPPQVTHSSPAAAREYTTQDAWSWSILHAQYRTRLMTNACEAFVEGYFALGLDSGRLEPMEDLSLRLEQACGWRLRAVDGLVAHSQFVCSLRDRVFPVSWSLRPPSSLHFAPAPDLFHDVMGHLPLLVNPTYTSFLAEYGALGVESLGSSEVTEWLARLYWHTVETGLVRERGTVKVLGTAIATSQSEWEHAGALQTSRRAFDLGAVFDCPNDDSKVQPCYFVLHTFDRLRTLLSEVRQHLAAPSMADAL